jgi:hypothetical protein
MKKYFLGFLAIILAIGFSAFTAPKKIQKTNQALYWYTVNSDMVTVDKENLIEDEQIEKAAAEAIVTCDGNTSNDCARGFTALLTTSTTSTGIEQIKRNN